MKIRIFAILLCLFSLPAWAQDGLVLQHQLLSLQAATGGTQLNYRLTLTNLTTHQYHDIRLRLEDVALSLTSAAPVLEFHTLGPGTSKYRSLTLSSSLGNAELQQTGPLLFHFQASDENGVVVTHLLRSHGVQP